MGLWLRFRQAIVIAPPSLDLRRDAADAQPNTPSPMLSPHSVLTMSDPR